MFINKRKEKMQVFALLNNKELICFKNINFWILPILEYTFEYTITEFIKVKYIFKVVTIIPLSLIHNKS